MRTVATAGHVDHGKSSLVYALTGTDPDRFAEEKTRGLTIDLGFAFTTLPSGLEIGFVDVPGHVRFIKNMLAGVGAVDVAVFVVAATEGWMPQSEEHLRILELLGVRYGMVVLTKADLVDVEMLELAQLEVEEHLAGSPLVDAPVVVCDSVSGRGLDEVRSVLDAVLAAAPPARDRDRPRLWVDRVFAVKGAGTVVTGTLTGGPVSVDDELRAGPHPVRVRGIESAGRRVATVGPGARVALNLAGVDHQSLRRGDAVVRPDQWRTPTVVEVAVTSLPGEDMKRRGRLQVAVGSGEHRAWFRALGSGGRFARLRFDTGLPVAPGDRLVLRDPGRRRTLAGAEVLDVDPPRRPGDADARLGRPLGERLLGRRGWLDEATLGRDGGLSAAQARELTDDLVAHGAAVRVDRWVVDADTLEGLRAEVAETVEAHHRGHPHDPGLEVGALADTMGVTVPQLRAALSGVADLVVERGVVRSRTQGPVTESADARRILDAFDAAPFAPPDVSEVPEDRELVRALVRAGLLVDVDGVVFSAAALDRARRTVIDALQEQPRLTVADIRDLLGSTRKYVVPLCGWLDRNGITRRRGDERVAGPAGRSGP